MNKKTLTIIPFCLILAACAGQPGGPGVTLIDCPAGSQPTNRITIVPAAGNNVSVAPPHICVGRGTTIIVNVPAAATKGSVSTQPKVVANLWLAGSNASERRRFELFVNENVAVGDYDYNVHWQNKNILDPRVSVARPFSNL